MKWSLKNISVGQVVIEFISVVFAVMLALSLNSYKQSRDLKKNANILRASILEECKINARKVDTTLQSNAPYFDFLDSVISLPNGQVKAFHFTYHFELLTKGAWEIAQNHDAVNALPTQFLLEASNIYQKQDFLVSFSQELFTQVGSQLSQRNELEPSDMALSIYYGLATVRSVAKELTIDYQNLLQKYPKYE